MANPFEALRRAIALQSDEILELAFDKTPVKEEVKRLNTEVQMYEQGLNADGEAMGNYSPTTIRIKQIEGKRYDHVTGLDTGEMYNSTTVSTDAVGINITINTIKDGEDFQTKYGTVPGLTESNTGKLGRFALPYVCEEAREVLNLR